MRRHARLHWALDELQEDPRRRGMTLTTRRCSAPAVTGLAPADEIARVAIDDGWGQYGVAAGRHEHLVCDTCGRIEPRVRSIVDFFAGPVRHSSGFARSSHQLVLTGTCAHHHPRASKSFMRLRFGLWRARTPAAYGANTSGWAAARISFATWAIVSTAWR